MMYYLINGPGTVTLKASDPIPGTVEAEPGRLQVQGPPCSVV